MPEKSNPSLSFAPAFAALVVGAIAMGISPVFVRFAEVGPFASAFWRVALALPFLLAWAVLEERRNGRSLSRLWRFDRAIVLAGIFFAGDLFFWHLSILQTTIANATLLACLAPVWVVLFSGVLIGEAVSRKAYIGLVLCLIGTFALIGSSFALAPERLLGDIFGFITSIFFGFYFLAIRVARRNHNPGAVTFMSTIITMLLLLTVTLIAGQGFVPQSATGIAALVALGVVSHCFGQGLLAVALGALSAAFSSLVIFIEALAAAVLGWLVLSEALTPLQFLGGALILLGVWVARPKD
ncbi:MAG: EamA family transporter [Rhizobiaceae bacterium]|nr:EamA family transporter [Rhizobiaceae bacterium]